MINDARYVKLREVSLSYEVPTSLVSRAGAKNGGLTLSARNLRTWTPYTGLDPESQFVAGTVVTGAPVNLDQAHLPQLMSVILTVRLSY